jgi:hypothetical protein
MHGASTHHIDGGKYLAMHGASAHHIAQTCHHPTFLVSTTKKNVLKRQEFKSAKDVTVTRGLTELLENDFQERFQCCDGNVVKIDARLHISM